jgi:hypothetical protein
MSSYPLLSTRNNRTWDISANTITTTGAITCNGGTQTGTFYSNNGSALRVPNGPTSTRPSGLPGYLRFNHDISTNVVEYFDAVANVWISIAVSPGITSISPNFVTDTSGAAGYYNTNPLLVNGSNFLQGATVAYRDPSGTITSAGTTFFYSGTQLGATVPSAVYNPTPYTSPFSIIVTNPGNYSSVLNNALTATITKSLTVGSITGGTSTRIYLDSSSGVGNTVSNPVTNGSTVYTFTTTANLTSTNLFTVTPNFTGTISYLVVAGGGAGAADGTTQPGNGGGGAGGYLTGTLSVTNGVAYSVQVGGGGLGVSTGVIPPNGANSIFATITSAGGGGGGFYLNQPGENGGSGGGGGPGGFGVGGIATPSGQGNNGGSGGGTTGGGGGGGAGGVGASSSGGNGGNGGTGLANTISGSTTFYAGGGGGSSSSTGGTGGSSIGGNGASGPGIGNPGSSNTGSGGGASVGSGSLPRYKSGDGGSGIVILRFTSLF